jgi:hypothetical protein
MGYPPAWKAVARRTTPNGAAMNGKRPVAMHIRPGAEPAQREGLRNHRTRVTRWSWRARPRPARTAAAIIATAALALLAACSGSPSPAGSRGSPAAGGSAAAPSAVGYSHCMRAHGVPNYPDPPAAGRSPRPTRSNLGSAAPSSRRPRDPAGTCTRTTARRSAPRCGNARKPATVHRPWCTR